MFPSQSHTLLAVALCISSTASAQLWTQRVPGEQPSARHSYVFESIPGAIILAGGANGTQGSISAETWRWDRTSWTQVASMPFPIHGAAATWDVESDRLVVFGGSRVLSDGTSVVSDLTLEYDPGSDSWAWFTTMPSPRARVYSSMEWVPEVGSIAFGGDDANGTPLNDTWLYVPFPIFGFPGTWTRLDNGDPVQQPTARFGHRLVFTSSEEGLLLLGGDFSNASLDTWSFDTLTNQWSLIAPASGDPPQLAEFAATADENGDVLLHGGLDLATGMLDSRTWRRDGNGMWLVLPDVSVSGETWPQLGAVHAHGVAMFAEPSAPGEDILTFSGLVDLVGQTDSVRQETWGTFDIAQARAHQYRPTCKDNPRMTTDAFPGVGFSIPIAITAGPGNGLLGLLFDVVQTDPPIAVPPACPGALGVGPAAIPVNLQFDNAGEASFTVPPILQPGELWVHGFALAPASPTVPLVLNMLNLQIR